ARRLTALREEVARDRADLHAALRAVAWTLARRLVREGRLRSVADAFDLSVATLLATARGASSAPEPRALGRATPPPSAEPAPAGTVLRGTPASVGIATGRVVVLDDLSAAVDLTGCVLVCRHTDPAWTPLLTACLAVVTERGGPLSHAAIVARELGVPAVVAVPDARALAAGASRRARVDGAAGTVTLDPDA
ncbi:MAG: pyruvate kinase, partial [Thermoleophilia bacterium]|nr:pyruvate kinase [Thermoleophilia bacterium]